MATLSEYQLIQHGYAVMPVALACKEIEFGDVPRTPEELVASRPRCNLGVLNICLRTLQAVGAVQHFRGLYCSTQNYLRHVPDTFLSDAYACESRSSVFSLASRFLECREEFHRRESSFWCKLFDGAYLLPLLVSLREVLDGYTINLEDSYPRDIKDAVRAVLVQQGWLDLPASKASCRIVLNGSGRFATVRSGAFLVTYSYRSLLSQLPILLFGDVAEVFARNELGEGHVDRTMNVDGSGFQHKRYFQAMLTHIAEVFNQPLEMQPDFVADTGSGDGTLLREIYECVKASTLRGRHLSERPLLMIGVDYNEASLIATNQTLEAANVPHITMQGDIGDPQGILNSLMGKVPNLNRDNVLHVRSFLDHDRPFIMPAQVVAPVSNDLHYLRRDGNEISSECVYASLVEHLQRWRSVTGQHGLLILEVCALDVTSTSSHMLDSVSLSFDLLHCLSGQYLVNSTQFLRACAQAGFSFGKSPCSFPRRGEYSRILLLRLQPCPVKVRKVIDSDVAALKLLEKFWPSEIRASEAYFKRRFEKCSRETLVAISDDSVQGVLYAQRIKQSKDLEHVTQESLLWCNEPSGSIMNLVSLIADTSKIGVGGLLRNTLLVLCSFDPSLKGAAGITRCANRGNYVNDEEYWRYVQSARDPVLSFHCGAGARVISAVSNFRSKDETNLGNGVLIEYDCLRPRSS